MKDFLYIILGYFKKSFSQEGEDLILLEYFKKKKRGFYIDIGAHHPFRFSNTYLFYKKGWRGINIDATPGSMNMFYKYRYRDINIEVPISNNNKRIDYFIFDEPALNSFSSKLSKERNANTKYKIKEIVKLKPRKLSEILDDYITKNTKIDFMSVDVEGYEYEVLISNNWEKYKPTYLLVEILNTKLCQMENDKSYSFLIKKGYSMINKTGRTVIFKRRLK
jgi:FkbM family methyltransferase